MVHLIASVSLSFSMTTCILVEEIVYASRTMQLPNDEAILKGVKEKKKINRGLAHMRKCMPS